VDTCSDVALKKGSPKYEYYLSGNSYKSVHGFTVHHTACFVSEICLRLNDGTSSETNVLLIVFFVYGCLDDEKIKIN